MTKQEILLIKGSVIDFTGDAIVNAANNRLAGGGGVDGAIHEAAGLELYKACEKLGWCQTGEAKITPGFNLDCRYIIHTVGPIYGMHEKKENAVFLENCYRNCLDLAKENNIHSIAFPGISTGVYAFPLNEACPIAIRTIKKWFSDHKDWDLTVALYCYEDSLYNEYQKLI